MQSGNHSHWNINDGRKMGFAVRKTGFRKSHGYRCIVCIDGNVRTIRVTNGDPNSTSHSSRWTPTTTWSPTFQNVWATVYPPLDLMNETHLVGR